MARPDQVRTPPSHANLIYSCVYHIFIIILNSMFRQNVYYGWSTRKQRYVYIIRAQTYKLYSVILCHITQYYMPAYISPVGVNTRSLGELFARSQARASDVKDTISVSVLEVSTYIHAYISYTIPYSINIHSYT